ncbi:shikimate dehydrogenase (NADP(+)) [Formosimonas limnophila]|uniref:Shikimate dehydrogenase (NADP(+)) n=1 Tax=Formosimonas limnophila TaxID=1384487 RepID=A0A8J3CHU1_9BURK|nr:shikimate dehydrogenase [Formosimonas limnophila]GHA75405.1 shikimate dehydrogenase (NADP(+)) [Formosimonas limnophila]
MSAKKFAVIGNPIAHSRSPMIHAQFAKDCGIELTYEPVLGDLNGFAACVDKLREQGYVGANLTLPFKREAYLLDIIGYYSPEAREAQAVNTLKFEEDGTVSVYNTDGIGLIRDITQNLNCTLLGKNVLVMGAGGAVQGVLALLCAEQLKRLTLINRTKTKAIGLIEYMLAMAATNPLPFHFSTSIIFTGDDPVNVTMQGRNLDGERLNHLFEVAVSDWHVDQFHPSEGYDVVINATSTGLLGGFEPPVGVRFAPNALAYDMVYGKQTAFLDWAISQGARTADGWGMLVEQAAKSFEIWHGVKPDTRALIATKGQ